MFPATVLPGSGRIRIAVSSPEIVARIRHEFTSKGLDVSFEGLPAVDIVVSPGPGAASAARAFADALNGLVGPRTHRRDPATARYRLRLITRGGKPPVPPRGHHTLTPRETQVMEAVTEGLRNTAIAARLGVREKTVKNHINSIFTKLDAGSRVEAVLIWQRRRPG